MLNIVLFAIGVWDAFSAIIYTLLLIALVKTRHKEPFDSTFFELFIYAGYLDLANIVYSLLYVKLPVFGLPLGPSLLAHPEGFLPQLGMLTAWFFADSQQLFIVIMAINRFTAICMPMTHIKIWSSKVAKVVSVVAIVFVLAIHAPQWTYDIRAGYSNSTGGVEMYHANSAQRKLVYSVGTFRFFGYAGLSGVLYSATVYAIAKRASKAHGHRETRAERMERRLAMSSMVVFLSQLLLTLYFILVVVLKSNRGIIKVVYYVGNDLMTTINPYALLAMSPNSRQMVLSTFGVGTNKITPWNNKSIANTTNKIEANA